jgi:hypothetical protein
VCASLSDPEHLGKYLALVEASDVQA